MKFFILIHSVSSLVCLKKLIEKGYKPDLVIMHDKYEREKLQKNFFIPIESLCKKHKVRLVKTDNTSDLKEEIKNFEIGFCVGYMKILRKDFFDIPKYGVFNLHCGKLPEYRGRAPISRTIMNGDKYLIATLHKIDEGVDSGPIAIETKIKITAKDDVNSLYQKFSENSYKSIVELLKQLRKGNLKLRQQKRTRKKAYTTLSDSECHIDWKKKQIEIFNKIRALKPPYPCGFGIIDNLKYLFVNSTPTKIKSSHKTGMISKVTGNGIYINTGDNLLKVTEVLKEGKKINVSKKFKVGDKFI